MYVTYMVFGLLGNGIIFTLIEQQGERDVLIVHLGPNNNAITAERISNLSIKVNLAIYSDCRVIATKQFTCQKQ